MLNQQILSLQFYSRVNFRNVPISDNFFVILEAFITFIMSLKILLQSPKGILQKGTIINCMEEKSFN